MVARGVGLSVFFVATGLSSEGDSLDRLTYLMEGAKVVISSRMQVTKQRGAASQEGVRVRLQSPQRDQYRAGKTRHGKSPMTRTKPLGPS